MNLTKPYHTLPYPWKVAAATTWGAYLKWWRYGKDTPQAAREALERDRWSSAELKAYQETKLTKLLRFAAAEVPFYRKMWEARRRDGDTSSIEVLENWPVLRKETVRANPKQFRAPVKRFYYREHTSGSTGTPLVLWQSRQTLHNWYALYEARVRNWNGVNRRDNWGIIGGQLVAQFSQEKPPFWVWNQSFHQLYLSAYHIRKETIADYINAMRRHEIRYLLGYPSALAVLAEFAMEEGLRFPGLVCVISNAEPLFDFQREVIARSFDTRVVNTYGMSEMACAASECQHGSMHLWPEAGIVEIMAEDSNEVLPAGTTGRIIATGLLNQEMPLIRYDTGDISAFSDKECPCGSHFPVLQEISGRADAMIMTPDGRRIGRLDPVFKADIPIREAQIIQEDLHTIRVRLVPASDYAHDQLLRQRMLEYLGPMHIILEKVDEIPRGPNGKFKAVISKL